MIGRWRNILYNSKLIPAYVWALLIFVGSTDLLSSHNTAKLFKEEEPANISLAHYCVRKFGHCFEFGLLYLLILYGVQPAKSRAVVHQNTAAAAAIIYAVTDEVHQYFIPSRTAAVKDVIIDSCGVLIARLGVLIFTKLITTYPQRLQCQPMS
eukprot:Blabericola_migrator_1__4439@NODE_2378_length_2854_cov_69_213491_g1488_i0_p2_GENE_NODE_2378_length_2854_cov_69_213491_g1488_i0NODE_2378_length_2854_cov_69_213491_g1488_i0_p2_ORF_typecomplete_len153_score4_92VanZ/PF04892_12/4_7e17CDPOH_P_transf/PF01066_21/5_5e03CDPOH_P_transf/PF01066_21/0_053_NODE_2378_length_2854_cov_69_213491_g1488_i0239697